MQAARQKQCPGASRVIDRRSMKGVRWGASSRPSWPQFSSCFSSNQAGAQLADPDVRKDRIQIRRNNVSYFTHRSSSEVYKRMLKGRYRIRDISDAR